MDFRDVRWAYRWVAALASFVLAIAFAWGTQGIGTTDTHAAMVPAWSLGHHGQLSMPWRFVYFSDLGEIVFKDGHVYSNRPLGMILINVPGQLLFGAPSLWGPTVTAAALTAVSVWSAFTLWGARTGLLVSAGTPLLYVGAKTLWPETVCIACLLVAILIVRADRRLWRLAPLMVVMTICRAPFGLLAVLVLAVLIVRRRDVLWAAAGLLIGLVILVAYSRAVFASWSIAGGYPVAHRIAPGALVVGLISPARGLLWWSPWILFVRPRFDRYTAVLAIAACYVLGSWLLYDAWGGDRWPGYRYALPFAVLAAARLGSPRAYLAVVRDVSIAWSVAVAIITEMLAVSLKLGRHPWSSGLPLLLTTWIFLCIAGLLVLMRLRAGRRASIAGRPASDATQADQPSLPSSQDPAVS